LTSPTNTSILSFSLENLNFKFVTLTRAASQPVAYVFNSFTVFAPSKYVVELLPDVSHLQAAPTGTVNAMASEVWHTFDAGSNCKLECAVRSVAEWLLDLAPLCHAANNPQQSIFWTTLYHKDHKTNFAG